MAQFIQIPGEYKKPSSLSRGLGGLGQTGVGLLQALNQQQQQSDQQSQLAQGLGLEQFSKQNPEMLLKIAELQNKQAGQVNQQEEKNKNLNSALSRIQSMRDIGARGRLGVGSGIKKLFGGKTAMDYAQYEQLGKSLISFVSPILIRNKAEFEVLAGKLYDPTQTDAAREGILKGLEEIINDNLGGLQNSNGQQNQQQNKNKQKRPLESFQK